MNRRLARVQGQIRRAGGIDILVSHAPALGVGDGTDLAHRGFETFNTIMERYTPAYMIHGHLHASYAAHKFERVRQYGQTQVINAYERYIIEL
jgi:Icc-related predicted phosphoesterase